MKKTATLLSMVIVLALAGCSTSQPASRSQPTGVSGAGDGVANPPVAEPLLDRMVGKWVLAGTIAGKETTHDVEAEWVLRREYVQLHEVSRELNADGTPAYEAIVFISWDQSSREYACLWLDTTGSGGLSPAGIGRGRLSGDTIPFLFTPADGSRFHAKFIYAATTGTWQWVMDGEEGGKLEPFARVELTKTPP
jgi:hypothetical protein